MASTLNTPSSDLDAMASLSEALRHPSDAQLLLANLRFLDLDRLPDWPQLTPTTFRVGKDSNVSQKDRLRSAEWVLYRLFEIWDSKQTRLKLQSMFPALEPVQSIKLRTALLQWLTQLKSNGVLARECALRKSIFDECKGERFEEILLSFSSAVLQKVVTESTGSAEFSPLAQKLAVAKQMDHGDNHRIMLLIAAHHNSLRSHLSLRETYRGRIQTLANTIAERHRSLESMTKQLELESARHLSKLSEAGANAHDMKEQLRNDCIGDTTWLSIILSGDSDQGRDGLIERPFHDIWTEAKNGEPLKSDEGSKSLPSSLEARVAAQESRLDQWRDFQRRVSQRNVLVTSPAKSPTRSATKNLTRKASVKSPNKSVRSTPIRMAQTRHKSSNSTSGMGHQFVATRRPDARDEIQSPSISTPTPVSNPEYDDLVLRFNRLSNRKELLGPIEDSHLTSHDPLESKFPIAPDVDLLPSMSSSNSNPSQISSRAQQRRSDMVNGKHPDQSFASSPTHKLDMNRTHMIDSQKREVEQDKIAAFNDSTEILSASNLTLSERTLQTLQQRQTASSATSQILPHLQSQGKTDSSARPPSHSSRGSFSLRTPEGSRPGTAKTMSTAPDTPATAGLSEGSPIFKRQAPGSSSPSPTRNARSRSRSPIKPSTGPSHPHIDGLPYTRNDSVEQNNVETPRNMGIDQKRTPPELLLTETVDRDSVFKPRSRLRRSPPASPLPGPQPDP